MGLGLATIGTNFVVDSFIQAVKMVDDINLVSVCSRSFERGQQLVDRNGCTAIKIHTDLASLSKDEEVNIVYVASPTFLHKSHSIEMMKAGKHVICEKPAATNLDELEEVLRVADDMNVCFMEAMRPIHDPALDTVKSGLSKIGRIHNFHLTFCQYSSRYDNYKVGVIENAFRPELSNGALMDIGVYCIQCSIALFGMPDNLIAIGKKLPESIDVHGSLILEYEDSVGTVTYSKVTDSSQICEVQGEKGRLCFDRITNPAKIWIDYHNGNSEVLAAREHDHDMIFEIRDFIDAVHGQRDIREYIELSKKTMKCLDSARRQMTVFYPADGS